MTKSEFELVVLENGDVGLQRIGVDDLLVRVEFSPEIKGYLGKQQIEVARRMIDTGIKVFFELEHEAVMSNPNELNTTLH